MIEMSVPGHLQVNLEVDLQITDVLGIGGFGSVYRAAVKSEDLRKRALSDTCVAKILDGTHKF
jgi:hypothetical protein